MRSTLEPSPASAAGRQTYGQILKSSALIGGSSLTTVVLGIVRTKAMAVLLGPAGVGLLGVYGSIVDLAQSAASLGTSSSGVRQIAEAVGSGDMDRIARTVSVLRRASLVLGLLGGLVLLAFASDISMMTFGGTEHAFALGLLSLAVALRVVSAGQAALIQGMRRISDLALLGILGGLAGTVISILAVYFFAENGIVPSLIAIAGTAAFSSWWYSHRVQIPAAPMTRRQLASESTALLKLGFAFLASALMTMGAAYVVRLIVLRSVGFEAAGLYQAAWSLGGLYIGFILQAMGADFYPRLTAIATNNTEANRIVNEQAQVSLLLAGPGVIATLTFAPLVIAVLYTSAFEPAVPLLRWICAGMMLRVVTWPMGFIILAKGAQTLFFLTELAWTLVHVGLAWICIPSLGVAGAGLAFFGSYIFHACVIYPAVRKLSGFRWSPQNRTTGAFFLGLIAVVFVAFYWFLPVVATAIGVVALAMSTVYSFRALVRLGALVETPLFLRRALTRFGFTSARS
jgi:enterobacterial common antigen flippase